MPCRDAVEAAQPPEAVALEEHVAVQVCRRIQRYVPEARPAGRGRPFRDRQAGVHQPCPEVLGEESGLLRVQDDLHHVRVRDGGGDPHPGRAVGGHHDGAQEPHVLQDRVTLHPVAAAATWHIASMPITAGSSMLPSSRWSPRYGSVPAFSSASVTSSAPW